MVDWHDGIAEVISDPLRFKAKLRIGEDAYLTLRMTNRLRELWEAAGASGAAIVIAQSGTVASTFFAPTGTLAFLGIGTAVTPIGWVFGAGALAGAGWIVVACYIKDTTEGRVTTIPEFINTPMDMLALGLFDTMAPLALKVASTDGVIDVAERKMIISYLVKEWGFNEAFIRKGMAFAESELPEFSIEDLAQSLAEYKKHNKDCNYKQMTRDFVTFLREVIEADGRVDEREEMEIKKVQMVFDDVARSKFERIVNKLVRQ